jgi:hypothetical protein
MDAFYIFRETLVTFRCVYHCWRNCCVSVRKMNFWDIPSSVRPCVLRWWVGPLTVSRVAVCEMHNSYTWNNCHKCKLWWHASVRAEAVNAPKEEVDCQKASCCYMTMPVLILRPARWKPSRNWSGSYQELEEYRCEYTSWWIHLYLFLRHLITSIFVCLFSPENNSQLLCVLVGKFQVPSPDERLKLIIIRELDTDHDNEWITNLEAGTHRREFCPLLTYWNRCAKFTEQF